MNKYEKQVTALLLKHEQDVLNALETAYSVALKDVKKTIRELQNSINTLKNSQVDISLINSKIYQLEYQEFMQNQINSSLDLLRQKNITNVSEYLKKMYEDGYLGEIFSLQLGDKIPVYSAISPRQLILSVTKDTAEYKFSRRLYSDIENLKRHVVAEISRGIAQGNSYAQIANRVSEAAEISLYNAYRISRTEGGRVSTEAQMDGIKDSVSQGAELMKRWDATLDSRVRQVHLELDGQTVEINEYFKSSVGPVFLPHHFGIAEQDINCRCRLNSVPKWDLDDNYRTKRNNMNGKILDYKDYETWKKEYLKEIQNAN